MAGEIRIVPYSCTWAGVTIGGVTAVDRTSGGDTISSSSDDAEIDGEVVMVRNRRYGVTVTFESGTARASLDGMIGVSGTLAWTEISVAAGGTETTKAVSAPQAVLSDVGGGPSHAGQASYTATFRLMVTDGSTPPFSET